MKLPFLLSRLPLCVFVVGIVGRVEEDRNDLLYLLHFKGFFSGQGTIRFPPLFSSFFPLLFSPLPLNQTRTVPSTAAPEPTRSSCLAPRLCRCSAVWESTFLLLSMSERAVFARVSWDSGVGWSLDARSAER